MHYKRWKRNGHFSITRVSAPARPARGVCVLDGCSNTDDGPHGLCKLHQTRVRRHGSPDIVLERPRLAGELNPNWTGPQASYTAVHARLRNTRGPARNYSCVTCGKTAKQWSYDHAAPDEQTGPDGAWSADLSHYVPRCVSCHKKFDLAVIHA
jgi:DNA-directed RNA polymerase subunit RPC12/RpoP